MPLKNKLSLSVQYADARLKDAIPRSQVRRWAQSALLGPAELTIRFVDADEGRTLNRDYRGKDYATNVLTFAYTEDAESDLMQADIVLCTDVLQREAAEHKISTTAHAAHLVVHGVLHAQGYDHETDHEAAEMEQMEMDILAALGLPNPYADR
ncbi:MAG: rRNA maturation RNase YbeY [Burkholderiales bacterium RIFCSPLOWO2_02_FULL_57_36]|nr:MAG: rRNA maturation RNase YbeY [Burkholderiales bacterium RIFCSPLOWO2_02_FULL_57_36]